jgi:hypothetical protein
LAFDLALTFTFLRASRSRRLPGRQQRIGFMPLQKISARSVERFACFIG